MSTHDTIRQMVTEHVAQRLHRLGKTDALAALGCLSPPELDLLMAMEAAS